MGSSLRWLVAVSLGMALLASAAGAADPDDHRVQRGITAGSGPNGIAAGPDGNLWFTERRQQDRADHAGRRRHRVRRRHHRPQRPRRDRRRARTATSGSPSPTSATGSAGSRRPASSPSSPPASTADSEPFGITAGPDGNLWFTERRNGIGRITTAGVVTEFTAASRPAASPSGSPPAPTATSGSPRPVRRQDRADHAGRRRHRVLRRHHRRQLPVGHHGRPGRQPLVHRVRRQPDRPDHAGRRRHRVLRRHHPGSPLTGSPPARTATSGSPSSDGNRIGRITPAGVVTEFSAGITAGSRARGDRRRARTATSGSPRTTTGSRRYAGRRRGDRNRDRDCQGQGQGYRRRHQLPGEMQGNDRIRSEADTARERRGRLPLRRLERSVQGRSRLHSSPESSGQDHRHLPQTPLLGEPERSHAEQAQPCARLPIRSEELVVERGCTRLGLSRRSSRGSSPVAPVGQLRQRAANDRRARSSGRPSHR